MDNNYNGYSPENGYDPENCAPLRDDATMLADDFIDGGDQFYGQNENIGQNVYVQDQAVGQYNNGYNGYDQSADYGQDNGYGSNNNDYPITPVAPVTPPPPPPQDFSAMYDQMFNKKQGASGLSIASLVFSILGLLISLVGTAACCCGGYFIVIVGILASAVGIILGVMSKAGKKTGSGIAIAGIIVGAIGLIWGIAIFAIFGIPILITAIDSY